MTQKRKAASPVQAGTLGETASKTTPCQNTLEPAQCQSAATPRDKSKTLRQRLKNRIVTLSLWGLIPIGLAEWIVNRLEVRP